MQSWQLKLMYGFLLWLIPLAISFVIFPFKLAQSVLVETTMTITLTAWVVSFSG